MIVLFVFVVIGASKVALMGVFRRVCRWCVRFSVRNVRGFVGSAVVPPASTLGARCVATLGVLVVASFVDLLLISIFFNCRIAVACFTLWSADVGIVILSSFMMSAVAAIVRSPSEIVGISQCAGKIW